MVKKIFKSKLGIFLRNNIGFKKVPMLLPSSKENSISVSDTFIWRTDNYFYTVFKFTDILKLFYDCEETKIELVFYDDCNNVIKRLDMLTDTKNHELIIDQKFIGYKGLGTFCIFHDTSKFNPNIIISNRCYVGYSFKNNLPSFAHGNYLSKHKSIGKNSINNGIIQFTLFRKNSYLIQNNFSKFDKTELFFTNPNDTILKFAIDEKQFQVKKGGILKVTLLKKDLIKITKSNSLFIRPIVFNYINDFIDVYHS